MVATDGYITISNYSIEHVEVFVSQLVPVFSTSTFEITLSLIIIKKNIYMIFWIQYCCFCYDTRLIASLPEVLRQLVI